MQTSLTWVYGMQWNICSHCPVPWGSSGRRFKSCQPDGHYDIDLNAYILLHPAPENTQAAIAYDLASFLTFLWRNRQPLGKRGLCG